MPGKRTLTAQLPRVRPLGALADGEATFESGDLSDQDTPTGAGLGSPIPTLDTGTITAERAAGRGDSDAAVLALGQLIRDAGDPLDLARAECEIATGRVESPLRIQVWADALAALAADAKAGYTRMLRARRSPLTFDGAIERLRGLTRQRADAVAIVNAYRLAGRASDQPAVEQLAALLAANDRSIETVEKLLGGTSSDVSIIDEDAPVIPTTPKQADGDARSDQDAVLARLPADQAAAYRAALALLDGKSRAPSVKKDAKKSNDDRKDDRKKQDDRTSASVASGGLTGGGKGVVFRIRAEAFAGVPDEQKNAHLAMLLLMANNIPADLAEWIATCTGNPPDRVRELESMKQNMDAASPIGSRTPIPPRAAQEGGYHGYRIFNAAGQTMTAAEIDAALASKSYIEVSLDEVFYREEIAPLLESPERWAWARADLIAMSYQREIEALEARDREQFDRTGRHDPQIMERLVRLKGMRLEYATYAANLRTGKTSVTAEMGKFDQEVRRLDALITDAGTKLADARKRMAADLEQRRREAAVRQPPRGGGGVTPSRDLVQPSAELDREVRELEQYIADRKEEKASTEQMMGTGDRFPDELARQRMRTLGQRYETTDGSFQFRSNARATLDAVQGAAGGVSARLWAGIGGVADYGGAALSFLSGEPWYGQVGDDLSRRAYSVSAEIDLYAAGRTAKAEEVLGKTATMLIQVATSTAIYVVMLGPVAEAGGVIGAAITGGKIGATAGSIAALATTGALMSSDQGGSGMATGALLMGAMPLFGGFGATALRRAVSAFVGMAALDGASQMDLHAAFSAYEQTRSYRDALAAATEKVDMGRMFANGLMGAMLAVGSGGGKRGGTTGETKVLRVADEYYRPDGTRITDAGEVAAASKSKSPPVRVNRTELESISSLQMAGNQEGALDLIARARTRADAITESNTEVKSTERDIARLENRPRQSPAEEQQLNDLRARRDRSAAQAEVLGAAQEGRPIPRDLIEKSGGQVPLGYAEAVPGGDLVPRDGLAAGQSGQLRARLEAGTAAAGQYKTELDGMNRITRELMAEQAGKAPRSEVLARLRAALAAAAEKVRALRAAFDRAIGRQEPVQREEVQDQKPPISTPTEKPIAVDGDSQPLGGGGQGTVYAVDVDGAPMAVKVPAGVGTARTALDGALLPSRYGGLGSGKIVKVKIGDVVSDGVLMPRVEGTTLADATRATPSQVDTFRGYMDAAMKDGVVLGDINSRNILLRQDGGVTVIDAPATTFEKFAEASRRVLGERATPEQIAADWKAARELFQWKAAEVLRTMESKIEGRETTPRNDGGETTPKTDPRDIRPTERPPLLDDQVIQDMAARTEADANNIIEGTCATAALRNTISAQIRGMKAYVIEIEGLTTLGRMLERLGVREGNVGRLLEKMGASTTSAHAIAAVQGADGGWRYLSWGRVEADYNVFAREAYGEDYIQRGVWETGDHVQWTVANRWDYPNATRLGRIQRALFGWSIKTGK